MKRSSTRSQWQTVGLALGVFALLLITGGLAFRLINRTPELMDGAQSIADVQNWFPIDGTPFYHWVSDDVLLYLDQNGPVPHLKKLRISTGTTLDYGRLPFSSNIPVNPAVWGLISPDSRYLLWIDLQRVPVYMRVLEIESLLKQPRILEWTFNGYISPAVWLPDSKRWFIATGNLSQQKISVFDTAKPGKVETRNLALPSGARWGGVVSNSSYFVTGDVRVRKTPREPANTVMDIGLFGPFLNQQEPQAETIVTVPWRNDTTEWAPREMSPDGRRLLWREMRTNNRWRSIYLGIYRVLRFLPLPRALGIYQAYWVSDSNGRNLRLLGIREITMSQQFSELRWTPDGQHVSFIYDGKLYVRPVR